MNYGQGIGHQSRQVAGAPFAAGAANEGLQVNPFNGKIQLGEEQGFATGLAALMSNREIIMDAFQIFLSLAANDLERIIMSSRFFQMETDFPSTGHRPSLSLNDNIVAGTLTTDGTSKFIIGTTGAQIEFDKIAQNARVVTGSGVFADDGAMLQVQGDLSTEDPLNGRGKWKLGKVVAGAVALNNAAYIEVEIDGVVKKLLIAI